MKSFLIKFKDGRKEVLQGTGIFFFDSKTSGKINTQSGIYVNSEDVLYVMELTDPISNDIKPNV